MRSMRRLPSRGWSGGRFSVDAYRLVENSMLYYRCRDFSRRSSADDCDSAACFREVEMKRWAERESNRYH